MTVSLPALKIVKFGDVVKNVTETCRDPEAEGLERYLGLEHLDGGELAIRRWGDLAADEVSFTRRFRKGQVLFGKRRAYQRKVALAEFDGVCSSDILAFESKDSKVLLPDLLPFLCQTDAFFDHALGTSAGSLSPRTRWSQLKIFEFPLPPLDEQKRLAELLWAAEEAKRADQNALHAVGDTKRALITHLTTKGIGTPSVQQTRLGEIASHWQVRPLGDLLDKCQYGLSIPLHEKGRYPILRMMNYEDGRIVPNDLKYVDLPDEDFQSFRVLPDDILFNRTNSADLVGKVGIFLLDGDYVFASYLVRLRAKRDVVLPHYLNYYLNSKLGQRRILAYATPGVSQTNISASSLKKVLVPVPPLDEQEAIVAMLEKVDQAKADIENRHQCVDILGRRLNQYWTAEGDT